MENQKGFYEQRLKEKRDLFDCNSSQRRKRKYFLTRILSIFCYFLHPRYSLKCPMDFLISKSFPARKRAKWALSNISFWISLSILLLWISSTKVSRALNWSWLNLVTILKEQLEFNSDWCKLLNILRISFCLKNSLLTFKFHSCLGILTSYFSMF